MFELGPRKNKIITIRVIHVLITFTETSFLAQRNEINTQTHTYEKHRFETLKKLSFKRILFVRQI